MFKKLAGLKEKGIINGKLIKYLMICSFFDILICCASIVSIGTAVDSRQSKTFMEHYIIMAVIILVISIIEIVLIAYLVAKEVSTTKLSECEKPFASELLFSEFINRTQSLTPTERMIFNNYLDGKTGKEVSELLGITMNTLKVHNNHIYKKLKVSSKEELSLYIDLISKSGMISEIEK